MAQIVLDSVPVIVMIMLIILVITMRCKKHWFFTDSEAGQENPYKLVCKAINFARKHKYPLQRSGFTYADNYMQAIQT